GVAGRVEVVSLGREVLADEDRRGRLASKIEELLETLGRLAVFPESVVEPFVEDRDVGRQVLLESVRDAVEGRAVAHEDEELPERLAAGLPVVGPRLRDEIGETHELRVV